MNDARREVELYIRATPVEVWDAITNPEKTRQYWYGGLNHSDWTPGAAWTSDEEDGTHLLDGEIVEVEAPHRLVHTFHVSEGDGSDEAPYFPERLETRVRDVKHRSAREIFESIKDDVVAFDRLPDDISLVVIKRV